MDGAIRDTNPTEEFVKVIKDFEIPMEKVFIESITTEHYFSNTSTVLKKSSNKAEQVEIFLLITNNIGTHPEAIVCRKCVFSQLISFTNIYPQENVTIISHTCGSSLCRRLISDLW